jgi:hypothetical protein
MQHPRSIPLRERSQTNRYITKVTSNLEFHQIEPVLALNHAIFFLSPAVDCGSDS